MVVEQVLFGYRDGHRRLAASLELDRASSSTLLGVTDVPTGSSGDRLITGLPLLAAEKYALSATWAAPELGRPGAVWAHTLLVALDDLRSMREPRALLSLLRRPDPRSIPDYEEPLALETEADSAAYEPEPALLAAVVMAGASDDTPSALAVKDLPVAESVLLAVWSLGWPALRVSFSFRTRDILRAVPNDRFVSVAHRVRGGSRPSAFPSDVPEWALVLDRASRDLDGKPRAFLREFGPHEPPEVQALRDLAEIFVAVARDDVESVTRLLLERRSRPNQGGYLKTKLFGPQADGWWRVPEEDRIDAIVAATRSIWDAGSLDLQRRLQEQISRGRAAHLVALRPASGPRPIRSALIEALVIDGDVNSVAEVAGVDLQLAIEVLDRRSDIAGSPRFWAALPEDQARALISHISLSSSALTAVAAGGQVDALLETVSPERLLPALLLPALLDAGEQQELVRVASALPEPTLAPILSANDRLRLALWNAGLDVGPLATVRESLEALRAEPDSLWYAAAIRALRVASPAERSLLLQTVFGPLHRGITDDRLDHGLWRELDRVVPPAPDPALRLRRLLVAEVRRGSWSSEAVDQALRDSGPHIRELRSELNDDDPVTSLITAGLKELKRWSPF